MLDFILYFHVQLAEILIRKMCMDVMRILLDLNQKL